MSEWAELCFIINNSPKKENEKLGSLARTKLLVDCGNEKRGEGGGRWLILCNHIPSQD